MVLTLDLPDELSTALAAPGRDIHRVACEALALEAYRENRLSTGQLRRILGFRTRGQVHEFLKSHGVWLHYTQSDLEHDRLAGDAIELFPVRQHRIEVIRIEAKTIVIADAAPLHYLILIREEHRLPALFGTVIIPPAVLAELQDEETPEPVRNWLADPPAWPTVQRLRMPPDAGLDYLDPGEREAIALAEELGADRLLIDESDGRSEAARRRLPFIGTLGILRRAARLDLIDLGEAFAELQKTSFYVSPALIRSLLDEEDARRIARQ